MVRNLLTNVFRAHPEIYGMKHQVMINAFIIGLGVLGGFAIYFNHNAQQAEVKLASYDAPVAISELVRALQVSDGDTFQIQQGNELERVRLCGIDAPERDQQFGEEAKAYLENLVLRVSNNVMIVPTDRGRYGRIVAEVFVPASNGDRFVQEELLRAGMAYVYPQYVDTCPNADSMRNAEAIARWQKVGVWSGNFQRPWDWRRQR
jgi:endonuclease YncB( thermonuclease family)